MDNPRLSVHNRMYRSPAPIRPPITSSVPSPIRMCHRTVSSVKVARPRIGNRTRYRHAPLRPYHPIIQARIMWGLVNSITSQIEKCDASSIPMSILTYWTHQVKLRFIPRALILQHLPPKLRARPWRMNHPPPLSTTFKAPSPILHRRCMLNSFSPATVPHGNTSIPS